jgi:hypothetical protein
MKKIEDLQKIVSAATPTKWMSTHIFNGENLITWEEVEDENQRVFPVGIIHHEPNAAFIAAFNPSLITKMIEEIKRGREFMDDLGFTPSKVKAYDKAREALDAELGAA